MQRRPSLATVFRPAEIAEMLGFKGANACQRAKRWLRRWGIARQDYPNSHVYTTLGDIQEAQPDLAAEAIARFGRSTRA